MNCMKKLVVTLIVMLAFAMNADAQGFLGRLKDRAVRAAENAVERKVENKVDRETDKAMDDVLDGKKSSKKSKSSKNNDADDEEDVVENVDAQYEQSDFVPGAVAFFEDNLQNEQMGEFPSKWDLIDGSADVANMKSKKCIHFEPGSRIEPLMNE